MNDPLDDLRDVSSNDIARLSRLTWFSSEPLGQYTSLSTISSGPVAILAGFVLASAVALASGSDLESLDVVAIGVFSVSAALLFVALTSVAEANNYFSTPSDRLNWFPEAQISRAFLAEQRVSQRQDFLRFDVYRRRALKWYASGASSALVGLALVLLGLTDGSRPAVGRNEDTLEDVTAALAALTVIAAAVLVLSFAPFKCFDKLNLWRSKRALERGMAMWPGTDAVESTALTDAATLSDWPPPQLTAERAAGSKGPPAAPPRGEAAAAENTIAPPPPV